MSIKDLFGKSFKNYQSASVDVESPSFITEEVNERETFLPVIDFSDPSNFAIYGSAELYYKKSISRIYDNYPYDGSAKEKIYFHMSSSYLDRYIFNDKYPKSTGFVTLGTTGYNSTIVDGYGQTVTPEYIRTWGGLHTGSTATSKLASLFGNSAVYNTSLNRTQNWRLNLVSGSTIEFWLKKDSFNLSNTEREVILDLWNGEASSSVDYGRLTLELTGTSGACFVATLQSGTDGFYRQLVSSTSVTTSSLNSWNHYAVSFVSASGGITTRFYKNGKEDKTQTIGTGISEIGGKIDGYIGALQGSPSGSSATANSGKLSASIDEFRFWKKRRTSSQIELNWFTNVGGGANSDDDTANNDLGVYYKFNEGIVGDTLTDNIILDYSGRLANGHWQGYSSISQRNTGSAFVSSSYNLREDGDPIIYSNHTSVSSLNSEMVTSGSSYDNERGTSIFNSMPQWIQEEDTKTDQNLKNITQILASYLDTLHAQITALTKLKSKRYVQEGNKPLPFAKSLLEDKGFLSNDLFVDTEIVEFFGRKDASSTYYEKDLNEIKNLVYTNIYNNLEKIYKSKGTESSIRNLIRCFGIDDEIVKLNMYTDGGMHYFSDKTKGTSIKKKYINFDNLDYFSSTIYQTSSANNNLTFISGSVGSALASKNALTFEADIVVPHKIEEPELGFYSTPFLSSSIFGFHEAIESNPSDYTWSTSLTASLSAFLVRDKRNSKRAKFVLKSEDNTLSLESGFINNIYDNTHWNVAIRIKPETYPYAGNVTNTTPNYTVDLYAVNYNFGEIENEVSLSTTISNASGSAFLSHPKRLYAGAHRTNFTGSVVQQSDVQIGSIRSWLDYLSNDTIRQHNLDPLNFGTNKNFRGSNIFALSDKNVPSEELTILNWDFDTVTGSDSSQRFIAEDTTSGSTDSIYSNFDEIIRREYRGRGDYFGTNKSTFIENEFLYVQKKELPEISFTNDNVFIKGDREKFFIKDEDISDNFYMVEKSLGQVVSAEMLNIFSSIQEFANLIGRPVDRYRHNYKRLEKVREHFFSTIEGDLDPEKFINYYRWIDSSISQMINQLIPASANFADSVADVIESHVLERNKYQRRPGLLDTIESTEGSLRGISELTYNWKTGHAPVESYNNFINRSYIELGEGASGAQTQLTADFSSIPVGGPSQTFAIYGWFNHGGDDKAPLMRGTTGASALAFDIWSRPNSANTISTFFYPDDGSGNYKEYRFTVPSTIWGDWYHLFVWYNHIKGTGNDAVYMWINGQYIGNSPAIHTSGGGPASADYLTFVNLTIQGTAPGATKASIDEMGVLAGCGVPDNAKVEEIYNQGKPFDVKKTKGFSLASFKAHYRFGDVTGDSVANAGTINSYQGSIDMTVTSNATVGVPVFKEHAFGSIMRGGMQNGHNNCLWRKDRQQRTDIADRDRLRKVLENDNNATVPNLSKPDKTIYQGSTYAIRKLSTPYKFTVDFSNSIHGGVNYNEQKNRDFYKTTIGVHGPMSTIGAPRNVIGIGIGLTDGINRKQQCDDIVDPNRKEFYDATVMVGTFTADDKGLLPHDDSASYNYRVKASGWWPFNLKSGSISTGYNKLVSDSYTTNPLTIVNLHADTVDITNEIPMQGPFTQAHVGGHQGRHVDLNRYDITLITEGGGPTVNNIDDEYSRPEAFRLLIGDNPFNTNTPDGAMGITGPDYGLPYPNTTREWAVYYREERVKRPVNIKNIQTTTGSSVHGNHQHKYEVLSSFGNQRHLFRKRTGSLLPDKISATLPQTTHFFTLIGQVANPIGNVFGGVKESNRTPEDLDIMIPRSDLTSSKHIIQNRFSAPGGPEVNSRGYRDVATGEYSVYNALNYRNLSVRGSGSGEPERSTANVPKSIRVNSHANRREGLRTLLSRHCGQFGTDSQWGAVSGNSYETEASFYKQHRNTLMAPSVASERPSRALYNPDNSSVLERASLAYPYPTTGDVSFSFWINATITSGTRNILDASDNGGNDVYKMRIASNLIQLIVTDADSNVASINVPYTSVGEWNHFVFCWPGSSSKAPKAYLNGIEQTATVTGLALFNYLREQTTSLDILNSSPVGDELDGSLSNLAIYNAFFTDQEALDLYSNNGDALSFPSLGAILDYWLLGEEDSLSHLAIGDVGSGVLLSEVGKNFLTFSSTAAIEIAFGPYQINVAKDVEIHDNMYLSSLLPASDFQYSWINSAISGSNWIEGQKIRGYAPKSGEITLVGGGSLVKVESAITFPTASTLYGE